MRKFNNDRREGGFNGRRGGFGGGRRDDRGPVTMHDAVCDECRRPCQVPFRPTGDRPIYCKNCFDKRGGGREAGRAAGAVGAGGDSFSHNDIKTQLAMINIKLDKLLKVLAPAPVSAPVVKESVTQKAEEVVAEKPKKVVKSKKVSKK